MAFDDDEEEPTIDYILRFLQPDIPWILSLSDDYRRIIRDRSRKQARTHLAPVVPGTQLTRPNDWGHRAELLYPRDYRRPPHRPKIVDIAVELGRLQSNLAAG